MSNYCLIRDIKSLLKTTFENKHGETVWTSKILDERAIDHLDGPFDLYCSLPTRTEEYLRKKGVWVSKKELEERITPLGYDNEHMQYLFTQYLAHHKQIGSLHQSAPKNEYENQEVPGYVGMIYKWHDMTPEEIADNQRGLDAFDAL